MPPLDPRLDFQDDGGAPGWRTRHVVIDIYPTRWMAIRAYMKRKPSTWIALGVVFGLLPWGVLMGGFLLILAWDTLCRLVAAI